MFNPVWIPALVLVGWAGWWDLRSRRIPNWLTVPALGVGLAVNAIVAGWSGAKASLEGAGLALVLLLPVVLLRGLGAGDWKLSGALGALLGPVGILTVLFYAILITGAMAVFEMIRQKRAIKTLSNLWELVKGFFIFGLRPNPKISLDNPGLLKLPFGVAAAVATVICFLAGGIGR